MKETNFFSWANNGLIEGCKLCVKGEKLVLFVTGLCPRSCFYCSISDSKYHKDVGFANERPVNTVKDIIDEAKANAATGAGFTGGDPLAAMDKTLEYLKALKKEFGNHFHVHLYTTPESLNKEKLKKLYDAGLDEIRIHPDLGNKKNWNRISLALEFDWDAGIEIPAIPKFEPAIRQLVDGWANKIKFLNVNELEIADNSHNKLNQRDYYTKDSESYAIRGSESTAMNLLKYCKKFKNLKVHFCTAKLKDRVQLANRIKLRAKNIAKAFDKITEDGTLVRGAIYLPGLEPGADYRKRIEAVKSKHILLGQLYDIQKALSLSDSVVDAKRLRILLSHKKLKKKAKAIRMLGAVPAIIEEYPTYDRFLIEVDLL